MNRTMLSVAATLGLWLLKPVSVRISLGDSPTTFASDGTLMHDQSVPDDSLEGWYVDVKGNASADFGFGTIELGVDKYAIAEVRERDGDYPPQVYLSGTGPLTITIDPITEDPG